MGRVEEAVRVKRSAQLLHSEAEVQARIEAMARQVTRELADRVPIVVVIMTGGMFLATRLCRRFDFPYELDYLHVSRYRNELHGDHLQWITRPRMDLSGRAVLLVDDVLDRGVTLSEVIAELRCRDLRSLHVAVLVSKHVDGARVRPEADFLGFDCPNRYLFGCGMDYKGFWRGLPALYAVGSQ